MKNQKNNQNLNDFFEESSLPDEIFRERLKNKVLSKYEGNNLFFNLFNVDTKKLLLFGGLGIFSVVALLVGGVLVFGIYQSSKPIQKEFDKAEFLAKVLEKNSQGVLASFSSPETLTSSQLSSSQKSAEGSGYDGMGIGMPFFDQNYNYSFDSYTTEYGKAKSKCEDSWMNSYDSSYIFKSDSYYYSDPDDYSTYKSKSLSYDKDGNLIGLYYGDSDSSITYNGGKFAVKYEYDYSNEEFLTPIEEYTSESNVEEVVGIEEPIAYEDTTVYDDGTVYDETYTPSIEDYFGEDIEVEEVVYEGKSVYAITSKYSYNCSDLVYSARIMDAEERSEGEMETIVTRSIVDKDTYEIYRIESYLDSISPQNLMNATTIKFERKNVDFAEVESLFEFDIDVPIKVVDSLASSNEYNDLYNTQLKNVVSELNLNLIVPSSSDLKLSYVYLPNIVVETTESKFYKDRDFYPEGEIGDIMYKNATEVYPYDMDFAQSLISLSYNSEDDLGNYTYANIDVYENSYSFADLVLSEGYREESGEIEIDGVKTPVSFFYLSYPEMVTFEADSPVDGEKMSDYEDPIPAIIFEYGGYKYRITISTSSMSGGTTTSPEYYKFRKIDLSNPTEKELFMSEFEKTLVLL